MKELSKEAAREVDAMIAEKAMGATWRTSSRVDWLRFPEDHGKPLTMAPVLATRDVERGAVTVWDGDCLSYSTEIGVAMTTVVPRMRDRGFAFSLHVGTSECLATFDHLADEWTRDSTRPVGEEAAAICEAALRALAALAPLEAVSVKEGEG